MPDSPQHAVAAPGAAVGNIEAIIRLEERAATRRSPLDRVADRIAAMVGTVGFVAVHLVWYALWLSINTGLLPVVKPFDRYPFSLLCLLISMEAVLLTSFVLIKQNRMGIRSERRAHLDLQVNLLAEREVTKVMHMLHRISDHLGMPSDEVLDDEARELAEMTEVEDLHEALEQKMPPGG
jgi:uncharacterized membrane protein